MAKPFTLVTSAQAKGTLARRFIPLADSLRDLLTKFGLRSYSVSICTIEWTGGSRGAGTPVTRSELEILPTPKIDTFDTLTEFAQPIGLLESGTIELSQVSGRFTEEQLRGFDPATGNDIPPNIEFFYEVIFFPTDGAPGVRRRFYPRSAPTYYPGKLQWKIRLEKSNADRARNGDPDG